MSEMIARARGALWDRWNKLPECPGEMYSREAHELAKATLAAALDPEDEKLVEIVARDMYAKHEPPIRADLLTWDELTLFQQNNWRRLVCNALAALKAHALGEKP